MCLLFTLYNEKMSENFESTYENSLPEYWKNTIISGGEGTDTISFGGAQDFIYAAQSVPFSYFGNHSPDTITFDLKMSEDTNKNGFWKYNEEKILKQLEEYITSTYRQHYVDRTGGGKEQTLDKIKHNRREGFCAGNVTKYIDRYDTKGTPRADLFKVLHYTILLINHLNLVENK